MFKTHLRTAAMESNFQRIIVDEKICNGRPTIQGYRITVKTILEYLAAGETYENILLAYPFLEEADIRACIGLDLISKQKIVKYI